MSDDFNFEKALPPRRLADALLDASREINGPNAPSVAHRPRQPGGALAQAITAATDRRPADNVSDQIARN